jgi:hypothetical protein
LRDDRLVSEVGDLAQHAERGSPKALGNPMRRQEFVALVGAQLRKAEIVLAIRTNKAPSKFNLRQAGTISP